MAKRKVPEADRIGIGLCQQCNGIHVVLYRNGRILAAGTIDEPLPMAAKIKELVAEAEARDQPASTTKH